MLAQTNAILRRRLPDEVELVTAFLGVIDGGVLRYANAGHVPPLVVGDGREFDGHPYELRTTGLPLGIEDDDRLRGRASWRSPAGRCCSRAPTGSSRRAAGSELFGQERVSALVAAHAALLSPQALVEHAYAAAEAFADALTDDVAIIALRPS